MLTQLHHSTSSPTLRTQAACALLVLQEGPMSLTTCVVHVPCVARTRRGHACARRDRPGSRLSARAAHPPALHLAALHSAPRTSYPGH